VDEPGYWYAAKPTVNPPFDPPYDKMVHISEILLTIAERAGFLGEVYEALNAMWTLKGTPFELDPDRRYPYLELIDRELKRKLGDDRGVDWLLTPGGGLIVGKPTHLEEYRGALRKGRIHLYYEYLLQAGGDLERVTKELGIPWDTSDYRALPDWTPCPSYTEKDQEHDLFIVPYKIPILVNGLTRRSPLLKSLVQIHRLDGVFINPATAARKGIGDGDDVWVETKRGYRGKAVAILSERVHPEVIATLQHKVSRGFDWNETLAVDEKLVGFVNASIDTCHLAKVYRA